MKPRNVWFGAYCLVFVLLSSYASIAGENPARGLIHRVSATIVEIGIAGNPLSSLTLQTNILTVHPTENSTAIIQGDDNDALSKLLIRNSPDAGIGSGALFTIQSTDELVLQSVSGTSVNLGQFALTSPDTQGTDPPAACFVGQMYLDMNTASDTNCTTSYNGALCVCTATNVWSGP